MHDFEMLVRGHTQLFGEAWEKCALDLSPVRSNCGIHQYNPAVCYVLVTATYALGLFLSRFQKKLGRSQEGVECNPGRARRVLPATFRSVLPYVRKAPAGEDAAIGGFLKRPWREFLSERPNPRVRKPIHPRQLLDAPRHTTRHYDS
jgi:hypothetical protein